MYDLCAFHKDMERYGFVGAANSYDAPTGVKDVDLILFLRR